MYLSARGITNRFAASSTSNKIDQAGQQFAQLNDAQNACHQTSKIRPTKPVPRTEKRDAPRFTAQYMPSHLFAPPACWVASCQQSWALDHDLPQHQSSSSPFAWTYFLSVDISLGIFCLCRVIEKRRTRRSSCSSHSSLIHQPPVPRPRLLHLLLLTHTFQNLSHIDY